ncbi:MAG: molecular chaperone HtpG [Rhodospirillales bacterium]
MTEPVTETVTETVKETAGKETFAFEAEVGKLLNIVARSLYSHKEIFLRELISNASDACDRLRYAALTEPGLIEGDPEFKILIALDEKAGTLSVSDNGIGMNRDDLIETLGTIARSGTQAFVETLGEDKDKDLALIGQFGVGFYSAFMVAERVEVLTRKAGEDKAWLWSSTGRGEYSIEESARKTRGTTVTLHLTNEEKNFAQASAVTRIVKAHSDHIGIPVVLVEEDKEEKLNSASAIWTRSKSDISDEQYKEFYRHASHNFDEPWLTIHNKVEGVLSYTNLLYVPSSRPFDLFHPERKMHVKLYVKRVFITDNSEGMIPAYLRFLRGVVDSEDLSLNISRETFQHDPKIAKIRSGLVKRVLGELKKKADAAPEEYAAFWENFGAVLKEGLYEDVASRDALLGLCRFRSTRGDGLVGLEEYVAGMKEGQEAIYYITGEDLGRMRQSPQLEGFKAKGIEVLLFDDPVDEFWVPSVGLYKEKPFKSATQGGADLSKIKESETAGDKPGKAADTDMDALIAAFKAALGEQVKDVRASERLTDSAVCLVADEGDLDIHLERLLRQHKQLGAGMDAKRILEINPSHSTITRLADMAKAGGGNDLLNDAAHLLFDQARIMEGEQIADASAFARRLASVIEKGLS